MYAHLQEAPPTARPAPRVPAGPRAQVARAMAKEPRAVLPATVTCGSGDAGRRRRQQRRRRRGHVDRRLRRRRRTPRRAARPSSATPPSRPRATGRRVDAPDDPEAGGVDGPADRTIPGRLDAGPSARRRRTTRRVAIGAAALAWPRLAAVARVGSDVNREADELGARARSERDRRAGGGGDAGGGQRRRWRARPGRGFPVGVAVASTPGSQPRSGARSPRSIRRRRGRSRRDASSGDEGVTVGRSIGLRRRERRARRVLRHDPGRQPARRRGSRSGTAALARRGPRHLRCATPSAGTSPRSRRSVSHVSTPRHPDRQVGATAPHGDRDRRAGRCWVYATAADGTVTRIDEDGSDSDSATIRGRRDPKGRRRRRAGTVVGARTPTTTPSPAIDCRDRARPRRGRGRLRRRAPAASPPAFERALGRERRAAPSPRSTRRRPRCDMLESGGRPGGQPAARSSSTSPAAEGADRTTVDAPTASASVTAADSGLEAELAGGLRGAPAREPRRLRLRGWPR